MNYEMNDAEKKLVEALRSGEYVQTQACLRKREINTGKAMYCCLGVASEISEVGLFNSIHVFYDKCGRSSDIDLTKDVMDWLNWADSNGKTQIKSRYNEEKFYTLASLNDSGFTFEQIADIIEAGLVIHKGDNE